MNDFSKRLLFSIFYFISSACFIHFLMDQDPSYHRHGLYLFTGKIVWLIGFIFKTLFLVGLLLGVLYLIEKGSAFYRELKFDLEDAALKNEEKKVHKRNVSLQLENQRQNEIKKFEELAIKAEEAKKIPTPTQAPPPVPQTEEDALKKAMDSIKFGGFS